MVLMPAKSEKLEEALITEGAADVTPEVASCRCMQTSASMTLSSGMSSGRAASRRTALASHERSMSANVRRDRDPYYVPMVFEVSRHGSKWVCVYITVIRACSAMHHAPLSSDGQSGATGMSKARFSVAAETVAVF